MFGIGPYVIPLVFGILFIFALARRIWGARGLGPVDRHLPWVLGALFIVAVAITTAYESERDTPPSVTRNAP